MDNGVDQLIHHQNHPQLTAHFEGTTNGLGLQHSELDFHGRSQRDGAWREEPQPGIEGRKHSLHLEKITSKQLSQDVPRVLRGRSSADQKMPLGASASQHTINSMDKAALPPSSANFYAEVRLVTVLNDCYWKNGRKNLQCFPVCPEHNDFYSMKINNRKHSSVGVCRGPVYCHVFAKAAEQVAPSPSSSSRRAAVAKALIHQSSADAYGSASLPSVPSGQHMKYEYGVGASGTGGSSQELFVLGRFERVPQRDNTDLIEELAPPPVFTSSAAFEEFRYGCFQAVEMQERRTTFASMNCENFRHENSISSGIPGNPDAPAYETTAASTSSSSSSSTPPLQCAPMGDDESMVRSTWFFLPDVWKVQPMLKKKRKATRSAPAQTFPFCFRVFVYTRLPERMDDNSSSVGATAGRYTCVSSTVSSFFELYSTRTVDRVKRKYWSSASAAASAKKAAAPFGAAPTGSKRQRLAAFK
uniref:Ig-like domain-containing protein n=1 Tax=Globisporangium ultimum (strain ATCC 200006 / CBS 805.95 / DAOM BR144) TaxID=431595 RepID=K3WNF0_GLOUD